MAGIENKEKGPVKKEGPKKSTKIKKSPEHMSEKHRLANRINRERQLARRNAELEKERLKIEANITQLSSIIKTLEENTSENIKVRQDATVMAKWIEILAKWADAILNTKLEPKKQLDYTLDNSINTFNDIYWKTIENLKAAKLKDEDRQKIYTLLEEFKEKIEEMVSKESDVKEKFSSIVEKNDYNMAFIAEWKEAIYAHIKKINKKFLTHFDCIYISAEKYQVPPELIVAIITNDSSVWKSMKTKNNPWNVWNFDDGTTRSFETMQDWLDAVAAILKHRIDKFKTVFPWKEPTAKTLVSTLIHKWKKIYSEYMTSKKWKENVQSIYANLAKKPTVNT